MEFGMPDEPVASRMELRGLVSQEHSWSKVRVWLPDCGFVGPLLKDSQADAGDWRLEGAGYVSLLRQSTKSSDRDSFYSATADDRGIETIDQQHACHLVVLRCHTGSSHIPRAQVLGRAVRQKLAWI